MRLILLIVAFLLGTGAVLAIPQIAQAQSYFYLKAQYNQAYCVHDPSATNWTDLTLTDPCGDTSADAWTTQSTSYGSGYSEIVNESTRKCLQDGNNVAEAHLEIYTCNGSESQALKKVTVSGLNGVAWQFADGYRVDNGSHLVRAWAANETTSQQWDDAAVGGGTYMGLGASQTKTQSSGYDGTYPLSDSYCADQVQPFSERVPANTTANNDIPPAGTDFNWGPYTDQTGASGYPEMQYNFSKVDGHVPSGFTTDEILEWAACKWGMDQDIAKAEAISESNWIQSEEGDYDSTCPIYDSWGILQVRATAPGDCTVNSGWGGYPWTHNSTAVDADAQMAYLRTVYDGQSYMGDGGNGEPVLTGGTSTADSAPIWNVISTWQSGSNTGTDSYVTTTQNCLASSCWTTEAGQ